MGAAKQSFAWACAGRKSIQMTVLACVYRKADAARLHKGLNGRRAAEQAQSSTVLQHQSRAHQVRPVEAFGETRVDRSQDGVSLAGAAVRLQELSE